MFLLQAEGADEEAQWWSGGGWAQSLSWHQRRSGWCHLSTELWLAYVRGAWHGIRERWGYIWVLKSALASEAMACLNVLGKNSCRHSEWIFVFFLQKEYESLLIASFVWIIPILASQLGESLSGVMHSATKMSGPCCNRYYIIINMLLISFITGTCIVPSIYATLYINIAY